jgi:hypothetical protein
LPQRRHPRARLGRQVDVLDVVGLDDQRRDRCPQFMCGIRDEPALLLQGDCEPPHQAIHGLYKVQGFERHVPFVELGELVSVQSVDFGRHGAHWGEGLPRLRERGFANVSFGVR